MDPPPNRLIRSTSPYLLQHAHNPVDWYPWGDEAFEASTSRDVPVFLSVGYAACHWCHVMERESFEDDDVAAFLNERFVSIKVDREERPDVDGIYMDAVQAMNHGQGGWPMSVFLTPQGHPFFAGTYYPDVPRHGMPSFRQVLEGIDAAWRERRDDIERAGIAVTATLGEVASLAPSDHEPTEAVTREALTALERSYDDVWGGFGGAPKFPQPMVLEFVARMAARGDDRALAMLTHTLDRMAAGGMYDQVGGGFARYSVDERWHVPHFEKMLYDNAQLATLYTHAWLLTRTPFYERVARQTLDYLLREMRQPGGGFWSSQDADTDGEEGRSFTWSWTDLVEIVGTDVAAQLGATPEGNWRHESGSTNVLRAPAGGWTDELEAARELLFRSRESRPKPGTDDKVIAAWNGLAITAFAEAAMAFHDDRYIEAALAAARSVEDRMRTPDGGVFRSWRQGAVGVAGFADDHALLAIGLLRLYEATGDGTWFARARALGDRLLARFLDPVHGGFFQTADDATDLVVRPKDMYDNAVPSGNSATAHALLCLAAYTGDASYEQGATSALRLIRDTIARAPAGFGTALCAIDMYLGPTLEIAIIASPDDPMALAMVDVVRRAAFRPNSVVAVGSGVGASVPLLRDRSPIGGATTAYVCRRFSCRLPVTSTEALEAELEAATGHAAGP